MEAKKNVIVTRSGTYEAIRVDDSFLCPCGCGARKKSTQKFFSNVCFHRYRKANNIRNGSPESITKRIATKKEIDRLLGELKHENKK